jgi:hypothetical protein
MAFYFEVIIQRDACPCTQKDDSYHLETKTRVFEKIIRLSALLPAVPCFFLQ